MAVLLSLRDGQESQVPSYSQVEVYQSQLS